MEFTYFKKTGELVDGFGGWDGDEGYEFAYEVEEHRLKRETVNIIFEEFFNKDMMDVLTYNQKFKLKEGLQEFIETHCGWDYFFNEYRDDLKDEFEEEALESEEQ